MGTATAYFSVEGNFLHTGDGVTDDATIANNLIAQFGSGMLSDFWMDNTNPLHVSCKWNGVPVYTTNGGTTWVKPSVPAPYQQAQCVAPNGSYLCFQTPNDLLLNFARSTDGGNTWTTGSLTLSSPVQVQYQPALVSDRLWTDAAGNVWLSLTGENNTYPNQAWPLQIIKSADNGQSFAVTASYSSAYTPPYGAGLFVSGTTLFIFAPIAGTTGRPNQHFLISRSTDGVTFADVLVTTNYNTSLNTSHGTMAALADGSLVVPLAECDELGVVLGPMALWVSTNQGQSWAQGKTLPGSGNIPREIAGDSGTYAYMTTWTVPTYVNDAPTAQYYWQSANSAASWQSSPSWFTGFSAAFAPLGNQVFWGVDSQELASFVTGGQTLFDAVKANAGRAPVFWGRYFGLKSGNLTAAEVTFLHQRNCKILVIWGGTTSRTVQTQQNGVDAANAAIAAATALSPAVPAGTWIYVDIEAGWSPAQAFFQGWFDTMAGSIYKGGVYCNTTVSAFTTPFCAWYASDVNRQHDAYVWTTQPNKACKWTAAPQFNPTLPPCGAPVVILQYSSGANVCFIGKTQVDLDSASAYGVTSLW